MTCTLTGTGIRGINEVTRVLCHKYHNTFLRVLITCGAVSTRKYKRVASKMKTSKMMNENMLLVDHYRIIRLYDFNDHYLGFLNSFVRIKAALATIINRKILCWKLEKNTLICYLICNFKTDTIYL